MISILVLEDEPLIALDLQLAFHEAGAEAFTAATCRDAMDVLESQQVDGAVLDVNLGNGTTCEEVAAKLTERGLPFVLHTGDLDRTGEYLRKFQAQVIPKPTVAEDVADQLLRMLRKAA